MSQGVLWAGNHVPTRRWLWEWEAGKPRAGAPREDLSSPAGKGLLDAGSGWRRTVHVREREREREVWP